MSGNNPINVALNPRRTGGLGQSHNTHNSPSGLKVIVRMDFLERGSDFPEDARPSRIRNTADVSFGWDPQSRPFVRICDATVEILNTDGTASIRTATTDLIGEANLNITDLNGTYTIKITTQNAVAYNGQRRRPEPDYRINCLSGVGPQISDVPDEDQHDLIFRPVEIREVRLEGGLLKGAKDPFKLPKDDPPYGVTHGRIGNRIHHNIIQGNLEEGVDPVLPVDMRPVWWKNNRNWEERNINIPTTHIVLHRTGTQNDMFGKVIHNSQTGEYVAHYYMGFCGHITKAVQNRKIAKHAGGRWAGSQGVNAYSLGIELLNRINPNKPYIESQYIALKALINDLQRNYSLDSDKVIGHCDVEMKSRTFPDSWIYGHTREQDPGQHFAWNELEEAWIGMKLQGDADLTTAYGGFFHVFPDKTLKENDSDKPPRKFGGLTRGIDRIVGNPIAELQADLKRIGYSLGPEDSTGARTNVGKFDPHTHQAVRRFQLHFLSGSRTPHLHNGQVNATLATMIKQVLNYLTRTP